MEKKALEKVQRDVLNKVNEDRQRIADELVENGFVDEDIKLILKIIVPPEHRDKIVDSEDSAKIEDEDESKIFVLTPRNNKVSGGLLFVGEDHMNRYEDKAEYMELGELSEFIEGVAKKTEKEGVVSYVYFE